MSQPDKRRILNLLCVVLLIATGLIATAQMWGDFQLYGHSARHDYFRQLSFDRLIASGDLYPRYMPDTYFGYGSPLFHFYSPLPYYMTEAFVVIGAPIHTALKMTIVLAWILSGLGMYLFCRDFAGSLSSFIAGLAFMLAPYHLVDMLVRHALGEHVAFAFLPFVAWGMTGMILGKWHWRLPVGALAFAALILTHNVSAMLGMGALGLWWGVLAFRIRKPKPIFAGLSLLGMGVLLAAFFWVPVLAEKELTYADESLTQGYFVYSDHFVHPAQLFVPKWGFGGSRKGVEGDNMSFQVGVPHWIFVLLALLLFVIGFNRDKHLSTLVIYGLLLFAGSVFFMVGASGFMYKLLPMLAYVQFPWRFLVFAAFGSSILAVAIEPIAKATGKSFVLPVTIAILGCAMVLFYAGYLKPSAYYYFNEHNKFGRRPLEKIRESEGSKHLSHIWELDGLTFMHESGETGTSRDDYLPRVVNRQYKPRSVPDQYAHLRSGDAGKIQWQHDGPVDLVADVQAPAPTQVEFARFVFPGWHARVNGAQAAIIPHKNRGTILVNIPAGQSHIEVRFGTTPLRFATGILSFFTLIGLFVYVFWSARKKNHSKQYAPVNSAQNVVED